MTDDHKGKNIQYSGPNAELGAVMNIHGVGKFDGKYRVVGHASDGSTELERIEDKANAVSWSLPRRGKTDADWMGLRMWVTPGVGGPWLWSVAMDGAVKRKGKAGTEVGAQFEAEHAARKFIKLREHLAAAQHDIRANWIRALFSCCEDNFEDVIQGGKPLPYGKLIHAAHVKRWKRQMETPYADLSEKEKDSDREMADRVLAVLAPVEEDPDPTA